MKAVERINFAVVAVTAALFLAIAVLVAFSTSRMMESEARSTVENVVKAAVGRIDRQMALVESAVENSAWIVGERGRLASNPTSAHSALSAGDSFSARRVRQSRSSPRFGISEDSTPYLW